MANNVAKDEKVREDILWINKKLHGRHMEALLDIT